MKANYMGLTARGDKTHLVRTLNNSRALCGVKVERLVKSYGKPGEPIKLTDYWITNNTCRNCLLEHQR